MNTYCDDCKRCTGGNMRKTDVPGGDDHNRCWECEATLQAGMAVAGSMISALEAERDALRERCGKLDVALHIAAQDLAFVASHSANIQLATMARKASNDAYAARSATFAATEARKPAYTPATATQAGQPGLGSEDMEQLLDAEESPACGGTCRQGVKP